MPSYNQGPFIERSLLSVLNQNYPNTQLIVMDGGSKDATRSILERHGSEIALWRSEPDRGQSDALNKGFRLADGDIFGWLNSDDLYLPEAFASVAAIFAARPEVEVVYGDYFTIDAEDRIVEHFHALRYSRNRLITEGFFCHAQAMFWRRSLHERVGEIDEELHYAMDYDLMLRMTAAAPNSHAFHRHGRPLGCFRVYPGQKTGTVSEQVTSEGLRIAARSGISWKYAPIGRALRLYYRLTRVAEHVASGRSDYLLGRLRNRFS